MALFKVNRGNSTTLPTAMTDGWAYFCTDTGEFFIDYADSDGILHRKQISADEAKRLTGYDISTVINSSDIEIPTSKAVFDALSAKADATHTHDDKYYTESEIDVKLDSITSVLEEKASTSDLTAHTEDDDKHITAAERDTWNQAALLQQVAKTMPVKSNWQAAAYGNGIYVAVATESDVAAYSTDGINWTQTSLPDSTTWGCVVYGNGRFVAFATSHDKAAYTDDGINWIQTTVPYATRFDAADYGNGMFVATSYVSRNFVYSTDGINWTQGFMPSSSAWIDTAYGDGKFVTLIYNSDVFAYSTNGTSWNTGTMPSVAKWQSIAYGNGKFVAITYDSNIAAYSTDGIEWTQTNLPSAKLWSTVVYGNGIFLAMASVGQIAAYSTDGIEWTPVALTCDPDTWRITIFGDGKFINIGYNSDAFFYSTDGIIWSNAGVGIIQDVAGNDVTPSVASAIQKYITIKPHAHSHAIGGTDPITPEMIGAVSRAEWEASLLTPATVEPRG